MMHLTSCLENNRFEPETLIFCMLVTVNLLAEGLVSSAELLLCLRDGEWARVGRDRAADADIRMIRMIEDCDIWSLVVFFVVHSKCVLLLDLGAQTTVRQS